MPLINVYRARDTAEAHLVRDLLVEQGIAAVVMGEELELLSGAIPFHSSRPTVCVDKQNAGEAAQIVDRFTSHPPTSQADANAATWRCPTCGEVHDAQFSACWKCQSPREDGQSHAPPLAILLSEVSLQLHLPCAQCEYDLCGLPASHRCPECGYLVIGTILKALVDGDLADPGSLDMLIRNPFEEAARAIGFPADALMLVCHAWLRAMPATTRGARAEPVDKQALGLSLKDHAIKYFGSATEAHLTFTRWGILGSEQVAQIITGLRATSLLPPATPRDLALFRKQFSLNDLFPI